MAISVQQMLILEVVMYMHHEGLEKKRAHWILKYIAIRIAI